MNDATVAKVQSLTGNSVHRSAQRVLRPARLGVVLAAAAVLLVGCSLGFGNFDPLGGCGDCKPCEYTHCDVGYYCPLSVGICVPVDSLPDGGDPSPSSPTACDSVPSVCGVGIGFQCPERSTEPKAPGTTCASVSADGLTYCCAENACFTAPASETGSDCPDDMVATYCTDNATPKNLIACIAAPTRHPNVLALCCPAPAEDAGGADASVVDAGRD